MDSQPLLDLGASLAVGLIIGVERGWRFRHQKAGSRVAGVRTYSLVAAGGGLAAVLGGIVHPLIAAVLAAAIATALLIGFARQSHLKDATGIVSALLALGLGLLAGGGQPATAVAAAAVLTLLLASRPQLHGFIDRLNATDVQAFARYAVIALAVFPLLPNRRLGPFNAWNPFYIWLVVVLVTGFSFVGYIANRTIGARRGTLAAAIIGGAYSSTAVTASLAERLGRGELGPLAAGIIVASAVMFVRMIVLVGILSPSTLAFFAVMVGPATVASILAACVAWWRATPGQETGAPVGRNPIELLPAFGFLTIVAAGAVATSWAQLRFGQSGVATSLFITGMFDVDAAVVALSSLPQQAITRRLAAVALAGTIVANMCIKALVAAIYARSRAIPAVLGLGVSTATLIATIAAAALPMLLEAG